MGSWYQPEQRQLEGVKEQSKTMLNSDSVFLDMESLSLLAGTTTTAESDAGPVASPRITLQKNLSRKSSQRSIEKKGAEAGSGGGTPPVPDTTWPSPTAAGSCRVSYARRGSSTAPWLGPRRVLFFFATLSSMGTIILLYFTLSMSKMDGSDVIRRLL